MDAYFMKINYSFSTRLAISQRAFPMPCSYCNVSVFFRGAFSTCSGAVCGLYSVVYIVWAV